MITGISGFRFFWSKMAVPRRESVFKEMGCWNANFYGVLGGGRAFWAKLSKKGNFGHPPQKDKFDW